MTLSFLYSDVSASYYFQLAKNISVLLSLPAESNRGIANILIFDVIVFMSRI